MFPVLELILTFEPFYANLAHAHKAVGMNRPYVYTYICKKKKKKNVYI